MARYKVKLPDGGVLNMEGPDGASDAEVIARAQALIKEQRAGKTYATPQMEPRGGVMDKVADGVRATANGAFPWADKLAAGVNAVVPIDKLLGKKESSIWDGSSLSDAYQHNLDQEQGLTKAGQENSPYLSAAGNVGGAIVSPLSKLVPGAGLAPALGNGLAYGAIQGSGQSAAGDEAHGGLTGMLEGAAGTLLGHGVLKAAGHVLEPVVDPVIKRLRAAGVPLTIGRLVPWLKGVEDKATSIPGLGDLIQRGQRASIEGGNRAMANEALSPIDVALPKGIKAGRQTAAYAQDAASKAYDDALTSMHSVPDAQFHADFTAAGAKGATLPDAQRQFFDATMERDVKPFMTGPAMTGSDLQALKRGLDARIAKLGKSQSPADDFAADALNDVRDAIMGTAQRQNPELFQKYLNADSAYANVQRLNDATARMRTDKAVSPLAFSGAVAKRGFGTTTAKVARGDARMQRLSDDLSATLPSSVPDSGSAGRGVIAALGLGGVGHFTPGGAAALGASALPYAPGIDRLLETIIAGERPAAVQTAGRGLKKIAPVAGRLALPSLLYGMQGQQ